MHTCVYTFITVMHIKTYVCGVYGRILSGRKDNRIYEFWQSFQYLEFVWKPVLNGDNWKVITFNKTRVSYTYIHICIYVLYAHNLVICSLSMAGSYKIYDLKIVINNIFDKTEYLHRLQFKSSPDTR